MPPAVFALALAAFCIGSTEFIVSGILLSVSSDLGVSIPTAGLLVTGYAAGVAVGGPLLGLLMTRIPLKPAILGVMAIFAVGQLLCALAPNYELLLGARLVSACGHGVFFGVASVAVSQLVPAERRGAALSLFVGGITVANILGLPGGTAIGNAFGWRITFVVIAVLAVLSVLAVFIALPAQTRGEAEADAPLRLQARQLLHQEVFLTYLAIAIIMVGQLAFGTFQVAMLTRVTGVAEAAIPYYLLLGGAGAVAGIWLGGKGADWNIDASILIVIAGQIVTFALLLVAVYDPIAVGIMLFFSAFFGFGFSTPVQLRILHGARAAPRLASTMVSTAYNIGIAAGAALGALLLSGGLSYAMLPVVGIGTSTLAGIIALVSVRLPHSSNLAGAS
ncbi:MAG TPA: MFS transporter [Devosia sp.]|jgi:DHA1 family inner membrane transport protein|nr:MFS transporter [Devosia sp.]